MVQQQKMSFADRTLRAARAWVVVGIVALAVGPTARSASAALPSWTVFPRPTWTQATPVGGPPVGSSVASAVDDPATGQLVLYDPAVSAPGCAIAGANSTWVWDGAAWTNPPGGKGPSGRLQPTLVYDGATRDVLMFGGSPSDNCGVQPPTYLDDTWAWNGSRWTQLHPATSPPAGAGACAAYDAATGQVVLFGDGTGVNGGRVGDPNTWTWDGTTWTPHLLTPSPPTSTFACGMTYDATRRTVVFQSEGDIGVSTWESNGTTWSQLATAGPELNGGFNAQVAYDGATQQVLLYNGADSCFAPGTFGAGDCSKSASETWAWNGTSWQLVTDAGPTSRGDVALAYDAATQQLVMFGGAGRGTVSSPGSFLADTWVYSAPGASSLTPQRLAGSDRDDTAVAVSQNEFSAPHSASAVVLARSDAFADALTGGPLAVAKKGPLLLTSSGSLDPNTAAEISRVLVPGGTIYLLGGTGALSMAVQTQVSALGFTIVRIAGVDRYATAVQVANVIGNPGAILEASGVDFPDALSAGPAAAALHGAVLLTNGAVQSSATATYLAAHPSIRYAVGGPAANADPAAIAVVGNDRYATSAAVARAFFPAASSFGMATGGGFADALSGGAFAGALGQPMLLVPATGPIAEPVHAFIATHNTGITAVEVFGGTDAVSAPTVANLVAAAAGQ
jgi:ell wall binding domain 2 (CWB2)